MKKEMFTCKRCGIPIGGHNQYLHDGMCDECFFEVYFPEDAQIFETDIRLLPQMCRNDRKENMQFRDFLKSDKLDQKRFDIIVKEVTEKIDCTTCGNCCKVLKPSLNKEDMERIAKHLRTTVDAFIGNYVTKNSEGEYEFKHAPCRFLQDDNMCRIYEIRPDECRKYPHLDKDVTTRCIQFFANAEVCPIVFNVLENAKAEFLEDIYDFVMPDEED
jgi:Fe-S-cluster containining protein